MSYQTFCASLFALSLVSLSADAPSNDEPLSSAFEMPAIQQEASHPQEENETKSPRPFSSFTGRIKGKKVRMRLKPDLDSHVVKELNKNELISIIGEKGDFYAVEPFSDFKAFVFRSFVLDNVIEGNHVNVRLAPNLEAPVIGYLNAGDRIADAQISALNTKWYEIAPPSGTQFYIAKEYVERAGDFGLKKEHDKRYAAGLALFQSASSLSQTELKKSFNDVDCDRVINQFHSLINDYHEFPELIDQAKEALAQFQESYLQKRMQQMDSEVKGKKSPLSFKQVSDKMKLWQPIEDSLYKTWASLNEGRHIDQFYEEQKLTAIALSGTLEPYQSPVKHKPGDFLLREGDITVACVYSTQVNLQNFVGKHVTLLVSERPNNHFAFPAFFVLEVE